MLRKYAPLLGAGLLPLLLLAGFLLRPVRLHVDGEIHRIASALTVGQALNRTGLQLDPADHVEPPLDSLIPLNGQIHVTRAVQVTLWEDGRQRQISGLEETLGELLRAAGVPLAPNDRLLLNGLPIDADFALPRGAPLLLQIRRARVVLIEQEGQRQRIDSSAPSALAALWEAGIRLGPGDELSVSAAATLEELSQDGPALIAHREARTVIIRAGGRQIRARTTATTVGEALAAAGVALQGLDFSEPAEDQPLPAPDEALRVVRVREEIALTQELLPFESQRIPDPEGELDQTRVLQAGQYGVKVVRERARYENGQEVQRAVDSDWVASEPVAQTIGLGTRVVPKTLDIPGGQIEYWRAVNVYATSYSPCRLGLGDDRCGYTTSSGARLTRGIIAVTLTWYRMIRGMQVYVPGYGYGIIGDVGGGIPGRPWIDLGFDEDNFEGIVGWTTMYFLTPAPENVSWSLP
jgi:resuscitation-promoting factor RpfB